MTLYNNFLLKRGVGLFLAGDYGNTMHFLCENCVCLLSITYTCTASPHPFVIVHTSLVADSCAVVLLVNLVCSSVLTPGMVR